MPGVGWISSLTRSFFKNLSRYCYVMCLDITDIVQSRNINLKPLTEKKTFYALRHGFLTKMCLSVWTLWTQAIKESEKNLTLASLITLKPPPQTFFPGLDCRESHVASTAKFVGIHNSEFQNRWLMLDIQMFAYQFAYPPEHGDLLLIDGVHDLSHLINLCKWKGGYQVNHTDVRNLKWQMK